MPIRITSGSLKGRLLAVPRGAVIRPTGEKIRAALFNTLYALADFGNRCFLDLCSGSGAVGIEAVSRGFRQAIFVDKDVKTLTHLRRQVEFLGITSQTLFLPADIFSISWADRLSLPVDVIFMDPPYAMGDSVAPLIRRCIERSIIAPDGIIVAETDRELPEQLMGWSRRGKRYGETFLSFYRHHEKP
ncbi:MAG TPA: 16S rRNA (guanine(966)-N(2))-methyltransferase RsmD [bacterium]|nr:16S rRNA (guanine(966)-N(2))-methyltransferase RsmD [bacterium]